MTIGSLVQYQAQEGEPPSPAIIMRIWPEGTLELHVFHFESSTHIRAAHPSQVRAVHDFDQLEEVLEDFAGMGRRMSDLENELEDLRKAFRILTGEPEPESKKVTENAATDDVMQADLPPLELKGTTVSSDEPMDPEPVGVESTRTRKRAAYPAR